MEEMIEVCVQYFDEFNKNTGLHLTNAYALLNPDRAEAQKLVALVCEDLEYFRKHAMAPSHRNKKTPKPDEGDTPPHDDIVSVGSTINA